MGNGQRVPRSPVPKKVADWGNNRITQFTAAGQFVASFGTEGSGAGQLLHPSGVDVDDKGVVWVADAGNGRVELFDEAGGFITQLGSKGSGTGQFSLERAAGIAILPASGLTWITDTKNNRVQKWVTPAYQAEEEATQILEEPNDPTAEISVSNGLVTSVDAGPGNENTYSYSGDDLTSHTGPEGQTKFETDSEGHITKITLPNTTTATIKYEPIYHRAISVTVDPAGTPPAKTTKFNYQTKPRRTIVEPEDAPYVSYLFSLDGRVIKSSTVAQPPEIILSGNLWDKKETSEAIKTGLYNLEVQANSDQGIASIQVITGGNVVVMEKSCAQTEAPGIECQHESEEWVVETSQLVPGIMQVEALVEDRLHAVSSQRFWVNIPYTPPPPVGAPLKPTFMEVRKFRQAFGLDLDLNPATEQQQINNRIYDLLNAWDNPQTPDGQVARSAAERWGVPLRPVDVAEMEYREWYVGIDGPLIERWGEQNYPNTYAGYYVDHAAGGTIRVGFTSEQGARVAALKGAPGIVAADRIQAFLTPPTHPVSELVSLQMAIGANDAQQGPLAGLIFSAGIDLPGNRVRVGANSVATVESGLKSAYGASAPVAVFQETPPAPQQTARYTDEGAPLAGQILGELIAPKLVRRCTAGFSALEQIGTLPSGLPKLAEFILTAGHCFEQGKTIYRFKAGPDPLELGAKLGEQRSRKWEPIQTPGVFETDIAAVRLNSESRVARSMMSAGPVKGTEAVHVGDTVCESLGFSNKVKCLPVTEPARLRVGYAGVKYSGPFWVIGTLIATEDGDSGSPVFNQQTRKAVAIHVAGPPSESTSLLPPPLPEKGPYPYLKPTPDQAPGGLKVPFMGDLYIASK